MKPPKQFSLAGSLWTVTVIDGLTEMGTCDFSLNVIRLRKGMPTDVMLSTFFHELVHAVKFTLGEREHDEADVDRIGHMLHQFTVTAKY